MHNWNAYWTIFYLLLGFLIGITSAVITIALMLNGGM